MTAGGRYSSRDSFPFSIQDDEQPGNRRERLPEKEIINQQRDKR
jgi:hypothetical protein